VPDRGKLPPPEVLDVLACPKCAGPLRIGADEASLECEKDRLRFRIEDGIPVMLLDQAEKF
jgi:uncharacterized protein